MSRAERRHSTTSGVSGVMDRMPSATGGPLSFAVVALRASLSRFLLAAVVVDDPMVGRSHTVCLQLWELLFDLDFQPESSAHTCAAVSVVWNLTSVGGMFFPAERQIYPLLYLPIKAGWSCLSVGSQGFNAWAAGDHGMLHSTIPTYMPLHAWAWKSIKSWITDSEGTVHHNHVRWSGAG